MSFNYIIKFFSFFIILFVHSCGTVKKLTEESNKEINIDNNIENVEKVEKISTDYSLIIKDDQFNKKLLLKTEKNKHEFNLPLKSYIYDKYIFSLNSNSELLKFDFGTGDLVESIDLDINNNKKEIFPTSFILHKDNFVIGFNTGLIIKIDNKGQILWSNQTNKLLNTEIIIYQDILIAIYEDSVKAILLNNGQEVWFETYADLPVYQAKGGEIVNFLNLIYFILPNNIVGSIDILLGEKHFSKFDNLQLISSINNSKDRIYIFENNLVYLDEGEYLYNFDILLDEFTLFKHKISASSDSSNFINNSLIIKKSNYLQAFNINNGNLFWKIELDKSFKKNEIIDIKIINNLINIFFDNGKILRIFDGTVIDTLNLKIKNIKYIYFQNSYLFASFVNGKTAIF